MKTIAKELAEKAMAGKDFDRDFYIEYLRKLYEVMDSKGSKFGRDWLGTYYQMCLVSPRPWKSAVVRYVCCSLRN